jgi:pristinamycin I synthase-3/4
MSDPAEPVGAGSERGDMTALQRRVASLTPEQRARLEERLLTRRAATPAVTRIPRRVGGERCPVALTQQRLWFLDQLFPGSAAYNEPTALRLEGGLDATSLSRALAEIVARHEVLRTVILAAEGEPYQVVQPPGPLDLEPLDLSAIEGAARETALAEALAETTARPFDLSAHWPIRARLVRLGPLGHVLLIVTHHIASDGWSNGVLFGELTALYDAFSAGRPSPLPPLAVQYGDFAVWQRRQLAGGELDRQVAYWRRQLAGLPAEVTLPTDRPRPVAPTHRGAREARVFPRALVEGLKALGRSENATLFMTLLAGFLALLHRYTGQPDVVVGAPIAGRTRVEIEPLIGFFVGTLPLRGDLSGDPTVRGHLRRIREVALAGYGHQDVPFEKLVEELAPERSMNRNPIVQVMFGLQNARAGLPVLRGLAVSRLPAGTENAKFDVTVYAAEVPEGLDVTAGYSTELYDAGTIARLLEHFERLLAAMVAAPDARLASLGLASDAERRQMLDEWNRAVAPVPEAATVASLVEAQVARSPDAVAIVAGSTRMTYAQLDASATRLAGHLRRRGVGPGAFVGVCAERSPALVTALLAVLKTGAAYLPLDAGYPAERLGFMLADARPRLVLVHERLRERLPLAGIETVALDDPGAWAGEVIGGLETGAGPDDVAYATYTSGSTGRPKGILTTHRGVVNYLAYLLREYALGPADVVLPIVTVGFDASVREIFGALAAGARLVLLGDDDVRDARAVVRGLRKHRVTALLSVVPSVLRTLCAAARDTGGPPAALRLVLTSGEPLLLADVHDARTALCPAGEVVNQYGPTECTMTTTFHRVGPEDEGREVALIGRPIANTRVYVLDVAGQPAPIGVAGELYIGGAGVTRGYLERPDLTAERFLPDPFDARPGTRMYRTGDRGRWRPDGVLEFFGRVDDQVKIRGNRVEPGEVEARLREYAGVSQAAVVAWPAGAPDARLVAYVVPAEGALPSAAELRTVLGRALPEYMVPTAFVTLSALPLGPHGKLDRRALPLPGEAERTAAYVEPRHPLEWQIAAIWRVLLKVPQVGVFDDFFELGGHSLLAVQLMQRLEAQVGSRLPLTTLFSAPTVAGLAAAVQREETIGPDLVVPLRASGAEPPFFFFHGDYNGGGFYSRVLARGLSPEQPFYVVHPHPLTDRPVPDTMAAMVTQLVAAIRAVRPRGPYRLGGHCNGGMFALEVARRLAAEGDEVDALVVIDVSARNARFRPVRRLARALAWLGRLDSSAEAELFLNLRDRAMEVAWRIEGWRRRRAAPHAAASRPAAPTPGDADARGHGGEDLDLVASAPTWQESERVAAFRRVARCHVPGRYAGSVTLLVPEQRGSLRRDLWWSLVADRVEVHTVPGAHLTSITEHGTELAERLRACLAGRPRATLVP